MPQHNKINVSVLDELIIGRVEPHIYAFSTETVPNYLKVGDTYRPLETRLNEWRKYFPNLERQFADLAKADDVTFFRDLSIHDFLVKERKKKRLHPTTFNNLPYYSNEFFENAKANDINEAIIDIKNSHSNNNGKYKLYKFDTSRIPLTHTYSRTESYQPRPNQDETIKRFSLALQKGRKNLLMYAVMRFGKSFTSMCCATEMQAKIVVIVSAKADVREEWKKTVESHTRFIDYEFINSDVLLQSDTIISEKLNASIKVVIFLTLQDLQGEEIKAKHKEVFENQIDLLIIDETHFGARAEEYGKVLREENLSEKQVKNELKQNDNTLDELDTTVKVLNPKVRLHLSGTPYRILMGSEFTDDDIIAFYQFTDIAEDQKKWNAENLNKDEVKEWDNPYYGFPQMVRFAFNPNESSRKKMEELKKNGITYAFSSLFKPKSITKDNTNQLHKKFEHEAEILDLLEVIDGSKSDNNLLGFFDYDKIKEGSMCRHIVCVLPFRASCDALENLISTNVGQFKNLNAYEIINIAGVGNDRQYRDTQDVKSKIKSCEAENKKTITLTVNRMLTGSTVEEWDTMLYLKDTASPQEYDQAIFRLQNQYIKIYKEPNGDIVKYNMKPQTLLVDFDPNRMFRMQEQKSQIYNVNTDANGNTELEERIRRELEISPIVVLNNNKIVQVEPTDVLDAVRKYSSDKSVLDEAKAIPVDFSLFNNAQIRAEIEKQGKIGSKQGLEIKPTKGEGEDIDVPTDDVESSKMPTEGTDPSNTNTPVSETEESDFKGKFAMYYAKILFFAFLTDSQVKSLQEVVNQFDINENNERIATSLDLNKDILTLLQNSINPFILSKLDYKIQNINTLANDNSLQPINRASNAMKKFSRLSESEIVTPEKITDEMVSILPVDAITNSTMILDIAAKQGEFVYAVYKKYGKAVADNFYSIPTSKIAYEFTRKVYTLLELDVSHIECSYTSYDLIKENNLIENDKIKIGDTCMKFNAIVGNPPYQLTTDGTSDEPIYHRFMDISFNLSDKVTLITPARFLFNAGKTPKEWNARIMNDKHFKVVWYKSRSQDVFPNVDLPGGIAVTFRDKQQEFGKLGTYTAFPELQTILEKVSSSNSFKAVTKIIYAQNKFSLNVLYKEHPQYEKVMGSNGKERRLTTSIFEHKELFTEEAQRKDDLCILGLIKNNRIYRYIPCKYIEKHENTHKYKVIIPKSNGSGALGEVLSTSLIGTPLIGEPLIGYTQSFISIGAFETYNEAEAAFKYVKTKFARVMLGILKVTQDNSKEVWKFVPLQNFTSSSDIDWSQPVADIDRQLYAKYDLSEEEIGFIEGMIKVMG